MEMWLAVGSLSATKLLISAFSFNSAIPKKGALLQKIVF
jgi:hypothetical protein